MGFPVDYRTELLLLRLLFPLLTLSTLLRRLTTAVSSSLRLLEPSFAAEPTTYLADFEFPPFHSIPAAMAHEAQLPVARFSALRGLRKPDSCAVCLRQFKEEDELRLPANCCHVFHRSCLDRWVGYEQRTCPLCRAALISSDPQDSINGRP